MKFSTSRILTITLSLLICAAMVMMFVPYYASESDGVSLAAYTWFPTDHQDLTTSISESVEGFTLNNILSATILLPLCGLACLVLLLKFHGNPIISALTSVWGLWSLIAFSGNPALRLGGSAYTVLVVLFIAIALLSAIYTALLLSRKKKDPDSILAT